ncbi:MAG: nucleoside-triphosphatase [Candidatus Aminicenantes bacterium]
MIFILTGPVHSGKTTLVKKVADDLKTLHFKVDGFLSEAVLENETIAGYDLSDLRKGKTFPFIRRQGAEGWERIGRFYFIPQTLAQAKDIILRSRNADMLMVDEVGPLELKGGGLWPALEQVLFSRMRPILLVVRVRIVRDFLEQMGGEKVKIFDIREKNIFSRMMKEMERNMDRRK